MTPLHFEAAPTITLHDPLAALLGSSPGGDLHLTYADAVRLAGHSCPAVAGAWLMLEAGLSWLYPEDLPRRGGIEVHLREAEDQGTTGVLALVATLVTGAAGPGGFPGIGAGRAQARRGLLRFEADIDGVMALRRRDTGAGVVLDIDTGLVPHAPEMAGLMPKALDGTATPDEARRFAELWQDRVARLFARAEDPRLIHVYDWPAPDRARP